MGCARRTSSDKEEFPVSREKSGAITAAGRAKASMAIAESATNDEKTPMLAMRAGAVKVRMNDEKEVYASCKNTCDGLPLYILNDAS